MQNFLAEIFASVEFINTFIFIEAHKKVISVRLVERYKV